METKETVKTESKNTATSTVLNPSELRFRALEDKLGNVQAQLDNQKEMLRNVGERMEMHARLNAEAGEDVRREQQVRHTAGCLNILVQMCGALLNCRIPETNSSELRKWDVTNYEKFARI